MNNKQRMTIVLTLRFRHQWMVEKKDKNNRV